MFSALGSEVTLVVSRQQVLPLKDAEVAAVLEDEFLGRGVHLLKGARATGVTRDRRRRARRLRRRPPRRRVARDPRDRVGARTPRTSGSTSPASRSTPAATSRSTTTASRTAPHIYAAGDVSGKLPLSSVAAMQGRKIAEHLMGLHALEHRHLDYEKAASAIFTEPEIADVGLAEAEAFSSGRKIRVTKVPFSTNAEGAHQGRPARLREDHLGPGDRRGARRFDRRPQRGRAHHGDRGRGDERPARSSTSSTRCSSTPRWPSPSPTPRRDARAAGGVAVRRPSRR